MMLAATKARAAIVPSQSNKVETVIFVTSFIRARRFYNGIFQCRPEQDDIYFGTVKLKTARNRTPTALYTELRIPVDDFFYEYQRLQLLGVEQVGAVSENCHGEISMKIVDEDGNVLTIVAQQWI